MFDSTSFDTTSFDDTSFDFGDVAASFTLSPSGVTVTGERNFGMVGVGTNWGASNPFSITSGPGTEVSYTEIDATHATYRVNVTSQPGDIFIADSDSGTSQHINVADAAVEGEGPTVRGNLHWASGLRRRKREEEEEAELEAAIEAKRNNEAAENLLL